MPASKAKDLYLGQQLADLQEKAKAPTSNPPKILVKVSDKLWTEAEKEMENGDEEKAYIFYMKYVNVYQTISKTVDYKKDKRYYDSMIPKTKIGKAVTNLETLTTSLEKRYADRKDAKELEQVELKLRGLTPSARSSKSKSPEINGVGATSTPKTFVPNSKRVPAQSDDGDEGSGGKANSIDPRQLHALMEQKSTSFVLLDARHSSDYNGSRIKISNIMNVPGEKLKRGLTASQIQRFLHIEDRSSTWAKRTSVDKLILLDWTSKTFRDSPALEALYQSLTMWDRNTTYSSEPIILYGGFENFAMHYPMKTTNPEKSRPPTTTSAIKRDQIDLDKFDYPDLDTAFLASPTSNSNNPSPAATNSNSRDNASSPVVMNGAITMSNKGMEASPKPKVPDRKTKPTMPDRSAKPAFESKSRPSSSGLSSFTSAGSLNTAKIMSESDINSDAGNASNAPSELNRTMLEDLEESSDNNNVDNEFKRPQQPPPVVDRSLKAKMLLKGASDSNNMNEVLEAEADLVEDSLQLEKRQLEMVNELEVWKLKREKAAEEEMKAEMMKKEEALLNEFEKLREEKSAKDAENAKLRKQLDELKAKLHNQHQAGQEQQQRPNQATLKKTILDKEEEKIRIQKEIERKHRERLKEAKEAEYRSNMDKLERQKLRNQELDKIVAKKEQEQVTRTKLKPADAEPSSGGGLNRSHSSPNIAKMLEDEEAALANKIVPTPKFDRTSKPSVLEASRNRNRNLNAIWSTGGKKGLTGLKNLGNTCYMNSILQCLSNFTLPSQYFMRQGIGRDLNRSSSDTKGQVAVEFSEILKSLWSGQYKSIAPYDLKRVIGRFNEMFRGSEQQDAHEFLQTLMSYLHSDVNEARDKGPLPEQKNDGIPEIEAANRAWDMDRRIDRSFIRETFYGQWRSTLLCPDCRWTSVTYEPFFELPLKLPSDNRRVSLPQLIDSFFSQTSVPYKCPKCNRNKQVLKQFEIVKLPLILTVQLGRFYNDGFSRKKQNFVDFELADVDFGQYATACNGQLNRYKDYSLYGVCNHFGSLEGGHYTAYCYSQVYDKWYKYDDTEVYEMEPRDVKSAAAYILFYSAKN